MYYNKSHYNYYKSFILLFVTFFQGSTLLAWSFHTHRMIASKCLNFCPSQIYTLCKPYKEIILQGSTDPDTVLKDFEAHVYHINNKELYAEPAINRVNYLYNLLIKEIQNNNIASAAYIMGLLSHYISDINQPLHTAGREIDPYEDTYHDSFEKEVQTILSKISPDTINIEPTPNINISKKLENMALEANKYYLTIANAYKKGNRIFDLQQVVQDQIFLSVKYTLEFWISAFISSGLFKYSQKYMILTQNNEDYNSNLLSIQQQNNQLLYSQNFIIYYNSANLNSYLHIPSENKNSQKIDQKLEIQTFKKNKKKINLNKASYEELLSIPGIGSKRAKAIIEHRPYKSIYDIIKIEKNGYKLFNVKLLEKISDMLTVTDQ